MDIDVGAVAESYEPGEDIEPAAWQESLEGAFLSFYREEVPEDYLSKADRAGRAFEERPGSLEEWPLEPRGSTRSYLADEDIDADALYEATVEDLADVLYGRVQARAMAGEEVEAFRERVDRFRTAFDRLDVDFYEDTADHEYTVRRAEDAEEVFELGRDFGTCLGFDVSYEMFEDTEVGKLLRESVEDPHTLYMVVERDGERAGFSRSVFIEDEDGEAWLAVDTLELPRDAYDEHVDALKPLALGAIQAGLDAGVDAVGVAAREGSAKEVVDGYGGVSRELSYEKLGEPVRLTSHLDGDAGERTVHPLLERFEEF